MAFALVALSVDVVLETPTKLTCSSSLLFGVYFGARVDIVVRDGVGIRHSLPLGWSWAGGLEGCRRSTLQPGQRPGHLNRSSRSVAEKASKRMNELSDGSTRFPYR